MIYPAFFKRLSILIRLHTHTHTHIYIYIYIEQILEAISHKITAVRPPTPISKTILIRRTRHAGHGKRSKDELISDVLQWTPSHGRASFGSLTSTYLQQLCTDTGCRLEDLPKAMDDSDEW